MQDNILYSPMKLAKHRKCWHEIFHVRVSISFPSSNSQNVPPVIQATYKCTATIQAQFESMFDHENLSQSDEEMLEHDIDDLGSFDSQPWWWGPE